MSLYSSIDVPKDGRHEVTARPGFVGLYDTAAPADTARSVVSEENAEFAETSETKAVSDAVLQFAPSARRRPNVTLKRKSGVSEQVSSRVDGNDNDDGDVQPARPADDTALPVTSNVPRLEVVNTYDDYAEYMPEIAPSQTNRPRDGNRKRPKKSKATASLPEQLSWDDDYDPCRPVDLAEYLASEERAAAHADWTAHKQASGLEKQKVPLAANPEQSLQNSNRPQQARFNFAPPGRAKLNFAPAPSAAVQIVARQARPENGIAESSSDFIPPPPPGPHHAHLPPVSGSSQPAPPPEIETAEEAYQRRSAMQDRRRLDATIHHNPIYTHSEPDFPPTGEAVVSQSLLARTEFTAAPTYNVAQDTDSSLQTQTETHSRGNAPGQRGFAQRYMAAQGWNKGQGLGSEGTGRLAPLFIKPQKDGKTGKIIDRHNKHSKHHSNNEPKMSRVVLLEGMIAAGTSFDENLQQDIGDSCSQAYGKVERVKLNMDTCRVLVKFTDTISALRCMSTVEGREFNGQSISARYYREEDFENNNWTN